MYKRKDLFTKQQRSSIMAKIRSRYTRLDLAMRRMLCDSKLPHAMYPRIDGNPDFLVGKHVLIFCDSSFWHGRQWNQLKIQLMRGSNPGYWVKHISQNRTHDRKVTRRLRRLGYTVLRFWDDDIYKRPNGCIVKIRDALALDLELDATR